VEVALFDIAGPVEITPARFRDDRGYFAETFSLARYRDAGIAETAWIQDNQSLSFGKFTLRGLHFQLYPAAQAKLVRVVRGSIFDVAVDIRPDSPTYRRWIGVTLTADKGNQLYVPAGFAHGFLTLEEQSEVAYKVSAYYSKEHDRSVAWNDPRFGIEWPLGHDGVPILSAKDAAAPGLEPLEKELIWE
jgi:dTDP-4-dehydrorhamnose 3,5-epimerase